MHGTNTIIIWRHVIVMLSLMALLSACSSTTPAAPDTMPVTQYITAETSPVAMHRCPLPSSAAIARDLVLDKNETSVELHLAGEPDDTVPISARAYLWQDTDALHLRIEVCDPELVFAPNTEQGDHVRLWLAPPANRFSDQPEQHFHSDLLGQRYWIPPGLADDVLATGGWLGDDYFFADPCFRDNKHEPPEILLSPNPIALGVLRLDINPYGQQVRIHDGGWTNNYNLQAVANAVEFTQFKLHDDGYALTLRLPPAALGLIPVTGVEFQRLAIDVVAFDGDGHRTIMTSAVRESDDNAAAFHHLDFTHPLQVEVDGRLPFIGRPWHDLPPSRQALAAATPPYLLWIGQQWSGARLGPRPGTERGDDFCTAAIGAGLRRFEASFVSEAINYRQYPVPGRTIEIYQDGMYIDGEPVDLSFANSAYAESGYDGFRPRLREAFTVDADTVALLIEHTARERGRFSRGPCAAGSVEYLDLVLWSSTDSVRHKLASYSTCTGPSIAGEGLSDDELSWDGSYEPMTVDAANRAITLRGARHQYQWQLVKTESGWNVESQVLDTPTESATKQSKAARLLKELHTDPPLSQAELHKRLLAVLDADEVGLGEHELENTVCAVTKGMALDRQLLIVQRLGYTPTCLVRYPALTDQLPSEQGDAVTLLEVAAQLVEAWQPPRRHPIQQAFAYVERAQRLQENGRTLEAKSAYAVAALLARRAGGFPAQRRHLDTRWQPISHRLLTGATTPTWDFVLEHAADSAARESLVEYWLAEYGRRNDHERFDALLTSQPLTNDAYRYLLLFGADHPHVRERLLERGVRFDDLLDNGDTLLHLLVQHTYATPDLVDLLLANGVEVNQLGHDGETALQRLYQSRSRFYQGDAERFVELVQSLIDAGADVHQSELLSRALRLDALHGRNRPMHFSAPLLAAGADPERIDDGDTALHFAIRNELTWLIEPLLGAGVEIDSTDAAGRTALMLALFNGQIENAQYLIAAGADHTRQDDDGRDACDHLGVSLGPVELDPAINYALRKVLGCQHRTPQSRPTLWNPDKPGCGQDQFAFSARRDGVWSVYSAHRDGGDVQYIGGDRPRRIRVARGSNLIAWQDVDGIHVATCTGKNARRLLRDGTLLAWYPDGDRLLFAKWLGGALCTLYRDGSTRCVRGYNANVPNVDVAGDGQTLLVSANNQTPSLYRPETPGASRTLLDRDAIPSGQSNGYARFLPDGETVSFVSRSPDQPYQLILWRPDTGVGDTVLESDDPDRHLWHYSWSADAATVALVPLSFARAGQASRPRVLKLFERAQNQLRVLDLGFEGYGEVDWFW